MDSGPFFSLISKILIVLKWRVGALSKTELSPSMNCEAGFEPQVHARCSEIIYVSSWKIQMRNFVRVVARQIHDGSVTKTITDKFLPPRRSKRVGRGNP